MKLSSRLLSTGVLAALAALPATSRAGDLDWVAAPYLWAPSIDADLGVSVPPPQVTDDEFPGIFSKVQGGFLGHVEAQGDHFGGFGDFIWLSLGDSKDFNHASLDSNLDASMFELAAVYSPGADRFNGFDVFAGLRYVKVDLQVDIDPVNPAIPAFTLDGNDTFSDFMLGARYTAPLSDKWSLNLRGDGSWGGTEGTWNVSALLQRHTGNGAWVFGWRYMDLKLKPNEQTLDLSLNGPVIGYAFKF